MTGTGVTPSTAELLAIVDAMASGVARFDRDGRLRWASRRYLLWLSKSLEEVVGLTQSELLGAAAAERRRPYVELVLRGESVEFEDALPTGGHPGPGYSQVAYTPMYDAEGRVDGWVSVATDVTDIRRTAERLMESERRERQRAAELAAVLDAVPAAIWIADDPDCTFVTGSRFAHEVLRLPFGANLSKTAPEAERPMNFQVHDDHGVEFSAEDLPLQKAARTGRPQRGVRETIVFEDGTRRLLLGNVEPMLDAEGRPRGAVAAFIDVSELARAEETLREADRRKDAFLATLAHELRNPIAPIRYAVRLLRPDAPPQAQQQAREMIERQSAQIARLLDDLLDMSRVTRDVVELKRELLDVRRVVEQAVLATRPLIESLHHELQVTLAGEALWVDGDPTRLHQIVDNLLNNAAKYTDPGGRIEVSAAAEGERVVIEVRDTGIGLARESLGRVFELFAQIQPAGRGRSGLGIGLAVVKRLVELHGGTIGAHSEGLGRGTTFRVVLPRAARTAEPGPPETAKVLRLWRSDARVLVVDDHPDVLQSLALLLRGHGYRVHTAADGASAMRVAEALQPDVAILDLGLPDTDGYAVARWIRQQPWGAGVQIIAVTGWGDRGDRLRTRESGFDAHLVKPVEPDELLRVLRGGRAPVGSDRDAGAR